MLFGPDQAVGKGPGPFMPFMVDDCVALKLLRRDGGCARPVCDETRIERLHAHHLRHWLFGGRTDLTNLVLLCDRDHGLAHDLDLALSRRGGRLIAVTPEIIEAHHVTGKDCFILKVVARSMRHLEQATGRIAGLGPVTTTVVYSSVLKNRAITAATLTG